MKRPKLTDYIDPLGRWPFLFTDREGTVWIEYVITEGVYQHNEVKKYFKAPMKLLDEIIKYEKYAEASISPNRKGE